MNLYSKTWPNGNSFSLSFSGGKLSVAGSIPAVEFSASASADVADLAIDGLEKVVPGAFAKAALEQGRSALKSVA